MMDYTAQQIATMTLTEAITAKEQIENAGWYVSAFMADRLIGDEAKAYDEANRIIGLLSTRIYQLRRDTKEYKQEVLDQYKAILATKEEDLKNKTWGWFGKQYLIEEIEEYRASVERLEKEIAVM